jgi:hypothetical protein
MANEYNAQHFYGYNIRMVDYATTKKFYDTTKPIQGHKKKGGVDCRPLTVRRRTFETWYEKDGWVGMAFRSIHRESEQDPLTKEYVFKKYHDTARPLLMMNEHGALRFTPTYMYSFSTYLVLSALLPESIKFVKYGAKVYFKCTRPDGQEPMYYFNNGLDMTFVPYERDGVRYYEPTHGTVQESKIMLDRDKAKVVREDFKAFLDYFQPMADLLGFDPTTEGATSWQKKEKATDYLTETNWLARKDGEPYGERWVDGVEAMLVKHTSYQSSWEASTNKWTYKYHVPTAESLRTDYKRNEKVYRLARPFRRESVPIGTPFYNNYRE